MRGILRAAVAASVVWASVVPAALAAGPTIAALTPRSGPVGTSVVISGSGFTSVSSVTFSGVRATYRVVSSSRIDATVPSAAGTGRVRVATGGGTATSPSDFTVTLGILLGRAAAPPTALVRVDGSGFGVTEAVDIMFDRDPVGLVTTEANGTFPATWIRIPATAAAGSHWITAIGRASGRATQRPFTVRTDWAQRGFGPANTGYNPFERTLRGSDLGDLGHSIQRGRAAHAPVHADGRTFLISSANSLEAVPASCGRPGGSCAPIWRAALPASPAGSAAVRAGRVFTTTTNGKLVIHGSTCASGGAACSSIGAATLDAPAVTGPVVADDLVYVVTSAGTLYAFPAGCVGSCAARWRADLGSRPTGVAASEGWAYVGTEGGTLHAFRATCGAGGATCAPSWTNTYPGDSVYTPVIAGRLLVVTLYGGDVIAFDRSRCISGTCAPQWLASSGHYNFTAAAVAGRRVFVTNYWAVKAFPLDCVQTCAPEWSYQEDSTYSRPTVANGVVYVHRRTYLSSISGYRASVIAFPTACSASCSPLWSRALAEPASNAQPWPGEVTVVDGALAFADSAGNYHVMAPEEYAAVARPDPAELAR